MVVAGQSEPRLKGGSSRVLFEGSFSYDYPSFTSNYDVTSHGQRFVMVQQSQAANRLHAVLNWFEELKRLVPTN